MELPAGMLDDDAGDFVGTAAREVYTHRRHLSWMQFLLEIFSLVAGFRLGFDIPFIWQLLNSP